MRATVAKTDFKPCRRAFAGRAFFFFRLEIFVNQSQRNHAVASATGETLTTVKSLGFSMMEPRDDLPTAESVNGGGKVWRLAGLEWR